MRRTALQKVPRPEERWDPKLELTLRSAGATEVKRYSMGHCSVIVAREPMDIYTSMIRRPGLRPLRWHLSIAHPRRYPTWDEIATARELLPKDLCFAQILPGSLDEWCNLHSHCFHLWEIHDEAAPIMTRVKLAAELRYQLQWLANRSHVAGPAISQRGPDYRRLLRALESAAAEFESDAKYEEQAQEARSLLLGNEHGKK